jgi:peptidoglycan glycosyltransferase
MWVITGGNAKLIPITGVTLPFLSYGGSSLVTMLIALGLMINLSSPHPPPVTITLQQHKTRPVRLTAARLGQVMLILTLTILLITSYWSIPQTTALAQNASNPRYILAEERIRRGKILDRNAAPLADISIDEFGYVTRTYPVPEAAPILGYASLEHGVAGIEATCDTRLRGDHLRNEWDKTWEQIRHIDPVGQDIRLTIDANYQQYAYRHMKDLTGAAVLVDARTGDILVMASSPTYNPTNIDDDWESLREAFNAPLINRATHGLSQPGGILESILLASFWDIVSQNPPAVPVAEGVELNGVTIDCLRTPASETWASVFAAACPAPFSKLGESISASELLSAYENWEITRAPQLEIPTLVADWDTSEINVQNEILGQGNLLVTPLQMANVAAILGNDGQHVNLHLLMEPAEGCVDDIFSTQETERHQIIDAETAAIIRSMLPNHGKVIGHTATALAGPNRIQSWFIGLNSSEVPRYAVAVLIESDTPSTAAATIGRGLLILASGPLSLSDPNPSCCENATH